MICQLGGDNQENNLNGLRVQRLIAIGLSPTVAMAFVPLVFGAGV